MSCVIYTVQSITFLPSAMEAQEGVDIYLHAFISSALDRGERRTSRSGRPSRRYTLNRRLGVSQSRTGTFEEEKNVLLPLSGFELLFLCLPACILVTILSPYISTFS